MCGVFNSEVHVVGEMNCGNRKTNTKWNFCAAGCLCLMANIIIIIMHHDRLIASLSYVVIEPSKLHR